MNVRSKGFEQNLTKYRLDAIFLAIQFALMLGLSDKGHPDFVRSIAVSTIAWVAYIWLEAKYRLTMSRFVRTVVMITIISDGFFGLYLDYYVSSTIFDKIQHIFGAYAFSLFVYVLTVQQLNFSLPRAIGCILVISFGISLGTLYEIAEFLVDSFGSPSLPGQPSLLDTDLDLIGDTAGAMLAAIHSQYANFVQRRLI